MIKYLYLFYISLLKCFGHNLVKIQIFSETYEMYLNISEPYIDSIIHTNTLWINNIIFNNNNNLILYKTNNIIIIKDEIFRNNNFYVLALPYINIKTIRDLRIYHLPLLYEMKNKIIYTASTFNISKNELYIFFHYHPSYYRLHMHGCIISHPLLDTRYFRHYFIDDIIKNLKTNSNFYRYETLTFELKSNMNLFNLFINYN